MRAEKILAAGGGDGGDFAAGGRRKGIPMRENPLKLPFPRSIDLSVSAIG